MNVNTALDTGKLYAIPGPSGSGKTALPACFPLFTGCADPKGGDGQESNVNSGVEVDITDELNSTDEAAGSDTLPDGADNTDEPASSEASPDGFAYRPKDPENGAGIAVTPKE